MLNSNEEIVSFVIYFTERKKDELIHEEKFVKKKERSRMRFFQVINELLFHLRIDGNRMLTSELVNIDSNISVFNE